VRSDLSPGTINANRFNQFDRLELGDARRVADDLAAQVEANVASWAHPSMVIVNDLFSMDKEGDADFNLPRLLAVERRCSLDAAISASIEIHNAAVRAFHAARQNFLTVLPGHQFSNDSLTASLPGRTAAMRGMRRAAATASAVSPIGFRCGDHMNPTLRDSEGAAVKAWAAI
jgi:hypothetical protein